MIPTGISPTEAAFEVVGLVNAKSIIDFLFFETKIGLAVYLIGLLTALWRSVKETDFSILWSYLIMFCILLLIFIKPMASLEDATSTMEAAGWKGYTTQEAFGNDKPVAGEARLFLLTIDFSRYTIWTNSKYLKLYSDGQKLKETSTGEPLW